MSEFDLVTEADLASDKLIVERLQRAFPPRYRPRRAGRTRRPNTVGTSIRSTAPTSRTASHVCVSMGLER
jgi:hypothetical protein